MKTYNCIRCGSEWEFFCDDYNYKKKDYPTVCVHCRMSFLDFVREVYRVEKLAGTKYALNNLVSRIKYNTKRLLGVSEEQKKDIKGYVCRSNKKREYNNG